METLPEMLRERGIDKITALKIDVEGFEVAVLKPFFEMVPRSGWPSLIICEIEKEHSGCIDTRTVDIQTGKKFCVCVY